MILWNTTAAPTGGSWDTPGNWQGNKVPGKSDTAVIQNLTGSGIVYLGSGASDAVFSLSTDPTTTLKVINGSLFLGAGSSTLGGPVTVVQGAALNVSAGASVGLGDGQTLNDDGTLSFAAGDTVGIYTPSAPAQIVVNEGGTMTATGTTFSSLDGTTASVQVKPGGHLKASTSTFNLNWLSLDNASIYGSGDLTGDTFKMPIYVPYGDVQYLGNNAAFNAININAATLPTGQALALNRIGTNASNLSYVFPGDPTTHNALTIASGATLSVGPGVAVAILDGQTLNDDGTLSFAAGDTVGIYTPSAPAQIVVNEGGTMTATGTTFSSLDGTTASVQVESGGKLTATNSTFGVNSLNLNSGSSGQLAVNVFNTQLAINSGSTFSQAGNVIGNNFSSSSASVVASGNDPSATIHLENNYWGTANATQIEAKITDHHVNSSLPTVSFSPVLPAASPAGVVATAVAHNASATSMSADQTVTLTATVTSGAIQVNEGSVMFTILNGINIIGNPVTAPVVNGTATANNYTLPGGTVIGTYTIQAIYLGTGKYLGYIDASHTLTVNPTTKTNTVVSSSAPEGSVYGQTVIFTAVVTPVSPGTGTPTGTVTFKAGSKVLGTAKLSGGTATLPVPNLTLGSNSITVVYSGDSYFTGSTSTALTQTVSKDSTTMTLSSSAPSPQGSVVGQPVVFTAVVIPDSPGTGTPTGTVMFYDGTTLLGPAKLIDGVAIFTDSSLSVGKHTIKAVYIGDADFTGWTSTVTQVVNG
jgi:hypothetical protein